MDAAAVMAQALAAVDAECGQAEGAPKLSEKDRAGLVGTTAAKTLVVLLAPPPRSASPRQRASLQEASQQEASQQKASRLGLVVVVVHAKEVTLRRNAQRTHTKCKKRQGKNSIKRSHSVT